MEHLCPELCGALLQSKLRAHPLEEDHIRSYDHLVLVVSQIINENNVIRVVNPKLRVGAEVMFQRAHAYRPLLFETDGEERASTPHECLRRQLFYSLTFYADAVFRKFAIDEVAPEDADYQSPGARAAAVSLPSDEAGPGPVLAATIKPQQRWVPFEAPVTLRDQHVGSIPCMVGSSYCSTRLDSSRLASTRCPFDNGGYFVIHGNEKIVQGQKQKLANRGRLSRCKKGKFAFSIEIRSQHPMRARNTSTMHLKVTRTKPYLVVANVPYIGNLHRLVDVPIAVLFRLLGTAPEDIGSLVFPRSLLASVDRCADDTTRRIVAEARDAFETNLEAEQMHWPLERVYHWLATASDFDVAHDGRRQVHNQITSECLPQFGYDDTPLVRQKKAVFLGQLARRLLLTSIDPGLFRPDNSDDEADKHILLCHKTVSIMVRQYWQEFIDDIRGRLFARMQKLAAPSDAAPSPASILAVLTSDDISAEIQKCQQTFSLLIERAFSRGELVVRKRVSATSSGIVQLLQRVNSLGGSAFVSRLNTPMSREGKYPELRQLDPSTCGVIDPCATPEGEDIGFIESQALGAMIRVGTATHVIERLLRMLRGGGLVAGMRDLQRDDAEVRLVFSNGDIVGTTTRGAALAEEARLLRRRNRMDVSVSNEPDGVHIDSEDGTLLLPALKLSELSRIPDTIATARIAQRELWDAFLDAGILEYLSVRESYEMRIAYTLEQLHADPAVFSHVFPHAQFMFGATTSTIPFAEFNQGPRLTYYSNMASQALGVPYINSQLDRTDNLAYQLWYPQRPIAVTDASLAMRFPPDGQVPLVAIMEYDGRNFEDAIIAKKEYFERGGARITVMRSYSDALDSDNDTFCNPEMDESALNLHVDADYAKLCVDGFPEIGTHIRFGDVIIGKTRRMPIKTPDGTTEDRSFCVSKIFKLHETAVVDHIELTTNRDGKRMATVRVRYDKSTERGDKFSSRHGQKGTIGAIVPEVDLPFCVGGEDGFAGVVPDFIIAPEAIPSRMTIGQLLESTSGRIALSLGAFVNATPWRGHNARDLLAALRERGALPKVRMASGTTGEELRARVEMGPVFYQRLHHLVSNKVRARATGPRNQLTNQPTDGNHKSGGLRVGVMEAETIMSWGASATILGRLRDASDATTLDVCYDCHALNDSSHVTIASVVAAAAEARDAAPTEMDEDMPMVPGARCRMCGSTRIVRVKSVKAAQVCAAEMATMGIKLSLQVVPDGVSAAGGGAAGGVAAAEASAMDVGGGEES